MKKFSAMLFVVFLICGLAGTAMAGVVATGSFGGHNYELYLVAPGAGLSWDQARTLAQAENPAGSWDLAVITSLAEQNWIVNSLISQVNWTTDPNYQDHLWIGGFQTTASTEPGGFNWVTGEPFTYTAWSVGDPGENAQGTRDYLQMWSDQNWLWDAVTSTDGATQQRGFIMETVPEPATMLLLSFGLAGLAGARRKFKK